MALFAFDKVIDPITITANQELALTIGAKTLVQLTGGGTFHIFGLAAAGGNADGAVVTFMNISNAGTTKFVLDHESASASNAANRFHASSAGSPSLGFFYGGATYRYDGALLRWILLSHT